MNPEFRAYLGSTGFSGLAMSMQQLLVSWLLVGVLLLPADRVGLIQALVGLPGILLMLWGGASADRRDPRDLLIRVYGFAPVLPLFLIAVDQVSAVSVAAVAIWAMGMSVVMSFTTPAQQAILNRVSGGDLQRGISASTAIGFLVQITGLMIAGQMDQIGLTAVLAVQALCLGVGALTLRRTTPAKSLYSSTKSAPQIILEGLKATWGNKVILHVLVVNFASSIFNAGAFMTVFPFIIKRIHDGDAALLATMMAVFYGGATVSNLLMLKLMPFARPGRLFLVMQLTRVAILLLLWIESGWGLLVVATLAWGINMGFTTTLARTIVQESAPAEYRGRIMSVFTLGMMGSAPIGAIVLGLVIEAFGTLNALLPSMVISVAVYVYGLRTEIWGYRSPDPTRA